MWAARGFAGLAVLALAACGGPEPRGQLSMVPRPELTAPPGEMSVRMLMIVSPLAAGAKWGSIGLAEEGPGLIINADLRNAEPGSYTLRLLDSESCAVLKDPEETPQYVDASDDEPITLPKITVDAQGIGNRQYAAAGARLANFRGRSVVLFDGAKPVACGGAIAIKGNQATPQVELPDRASRPGGGR